MKFDLSIGELLIISLFFITSINCVLTYLCCVKAIDALEEDKSISKAVNKLRFFDDYILSKVNLLIALIYFLLSYAFVNKHFYDVTYIFFYSCLMSFCFTLITTFIARLCYCYTCNLLLETKLREIECLTMNFKRLLTVYAPFVVISIIVPSIYLIEMNSVVRNIACASSLVAILIAWICLTPKFMMFNYGARKLKGRSALKYRLDQLMELHNIKNYRLYVWDTSRSKEDNAMVSGVFVYHLFISSSLIENVTLPELETIITHEIGHIKNNHLIKKMIGKFFIIAPLSLITVMPYILDFSGFNKGLVYLLIVLLSCLGILISIGVERKYEIEADLYVANYNDPDLFERALKKISKYDLEESKVDEKLQVHPSLENRVKNIKKNNKN